MRKMLLVMAALLLSACGTRYLVPATSDKSAYFTESSYTEAACRQKLRDVSRERQWEITLMPTSTDVRGIVAELLLFPFYKGFSCSAEIVKGNAGRPEDF